MIKLSELKKGETFKVEDEEGKETEKIVTKKEEKDGVISTVFKNK